MWNDIETLKVISHALMYCTMGLAIAAALSTGGRFYIDRRAGSLEKAASKAERDAQKAREDKLAQEVSSAQEAQRISDEKLANVEALTRQRHLSDVQKTTIVELIRALVPPVPRITVTAANSNNESQVFAREFVDAFRAAGCQSDLLLPIPGLTADVVGVRIGVRNTENLPTSAVQLAEIFSAAKIPFSVSSLSVDFFPGVPLVLAVGSK